MYVKILSVFFAVICIVASAVPAVASDQSESQNYFEAVNVLEGSGSVRSIEGYKVTKCHSAEGDIVVAESKGPELLSLIKWTNGEVYNLYPTQSPEFQQPWFEEWPIEYALDKGGKSGKNWLNKFDEYKLRQFIWWDGGGSNKVISRTVSDSGGTISVGDNIYDMFPRWDKDIATVIKWSKEIAVF